MVMSECISASKCWSLLRGGLSQEGSLNRGTTVYTLEVVSHRRGLSIEGPLYIP